MPTRAAAMSMPEEDLLAEIRDTLKAKGAGGPGAA